MSGIVLFISELLQHLPSLPLLSVLPKLLEAGVINQSEFDSILQLLDR